MAAAVLIVSHGSKKPKRIGLYPPADVHRVASRVLEASIEYPTTSPATFIRPDEPPELM